MKKAKLSRYTCATRNGASKYNGYDELDCTDCVPFGGSGTHELILRNPTATLLVLDWQARDAQELLDWIDEDDRITDKPTITLQVTGKPTCIECGSDNLGYVPMSKVLVMTRKCLNCGHEWKAQDD